MAQAHKTPPRLALSVLGCFLLGAMLLAGALAAFVPEYSRAVTDRALDQSVQTRTQSAALDFARALQSDWQEVRHLAGIAGATPPGQMRAALDGLVGSGSRVSWAGFTGLDGRVIAASGGLLEEMDVSARPWFEAGLRGPFAGDVHDAVLLNRLLGGDEDEPLRFIDFALPVRDPETGEVTGVLASHTTFGWLERFLSETAEVRNLDLFLVDATGAVVFATDPSEADVRSVQALRAAATGTAAQTREVWPDGQEYFASTVPQVAYGDLPSFGWRLVGRVPGDAHDADRRALMGTLGAIIAGAVAMFAVAAGLFAAVFVRPLSRLVASAERIAAGRPDYPPESRSSAEAVRLSAALARIQTRLETHDSADDRPAADRPRSTDPQ